MKKDIRHIPLFVLLTVTFTSMLGCSILSGGSYKKANTSQAQMQQDLAECEYKVQLNNVPLERQFYTKKLCMQGKGYTHQP